VDRVPVAVDLSGRNLDELADAIGPFAHVLPDTLDLGAFASFADVVADERARLVEAARWQHYAPEWLPSPADVDPRIAVVPCAFSAANVPLHLTSGALSARITRLWTTSDQAALRLWCNLAALADATLVYDAMLFGQDTIRDVAERFGILATAAATTPEAS